MGRSEANGVEKQRGCAETESYDQLMGKFMDEGPNTRSRGESRQQFPPSRFESLVHVSVYRSLTQIYHETQLTPLANARYWQNSPGTSLQGAYRGFILGGKSMPWPTVQCMA